MVHGILVNKLIKLAFQSSSKKMGFSILGYIAIKISDPHYTSSLPIKNIPREYYKSNRIYENMFMTS